MENVFIGIWVWSVRERPHWLRHWQGVESPCITSPWRTTCTWLIFTRTCRSTRFRFRSICWTNDSSSSSSRVERKRRCAGQNDLRGYGVCKCLKSGHMSQRDYETYLSLFSNISFHEETQRASGWARSRVGSYQDEKSRMWVRYVSRLPQGIASSVRGIYFGHPTCHSCHQSDYKILMATGGEKLKALRLRTSTRGV